MSVKLDLFEPGSFHVDPQAMAEAVRQLPNGNPGLVAASYVVKPTSGLLFGFTVSSIAAQFVQLFDLAAVPADTAVPTVVVAVAATSFVRVEYVQPRAFRNGIVICNSSTQHTKTVGSADCIFDVQFL